MCAVAAVSGGYAFIKTVVCALIGQNRTDTETVGDAGLDADMCIVGSLLVGTVCAAMVVGLLRTCFQPDVLLLRIGKVEVDAASRLLSAGIVGGLFGNGGVGRPADQFGLVRYMDAGNAGFQTVDLSGQMVECVQVGVSCCFDGLRIAVLPCFVKFGFGRFYTFYVRIQFGFEECQVVRVGSFGNLTADVGTVSLCGTQVLGTRQNAGQRVCLFQLGGQILDLAVDAGKFGLTVLPGL